MYTVESLSDGNHISVSLSNHFAGYYEARHIYTFGCPFWIICKLINTSQHNSTGDNLTVTSNSTTHEYIIKKGIISQQALQS